MGINYKYIEKHQKYKGVFIRHKENGAILYQANVGKTSKTFNNDRDAAICVDLYKIRIGKEPVNILVRKA